MAGIRKDFARNDVVVAGRGMVVPKELGTILDREHNAYFNDVYYYNGVTSTYPSTDRQSLRAKLFTQTITATSGTITAKEGTIVLEPTGAATYTLEDPAATDDGKVLRFIAGTAQNITINGTFNTTPDTFNRVLPATVGDHVWVQAINGRWHDVVSRGFVNV